MATLPAGFSITSIDGLRCTAVPKTATTLTGAFIAEAASLSAASAAAATASTTEAAPTQATASSVQIQNPPNIVAGTSSALSSTSTSTISSSSSSSISVVASSSQLTLTSSIATSASAVVLSTSSVEPVSSFSATALPASKGTTPTTSKTTPLPIAQSEVHASATPVTIGGDGNNNDNGFQSPSKTTNTPSTSLLASTANPRESSAASGISSNPKLTAAPVVGGVLGAAGLVAIVALIFWFFRRRRRSKRDSLLTPLTTGRRSEFYEIDNGSVGPTPRGEKLKAAVSYQTGRLRNAAAGIKSGVAGIGASLKLKVGGARSDTPSVNLNRGNSQFIDGPIPQHSRNNSTLSRATDHLSAKDKFSDWWERFTENVSFNWRLRKNPSEPADPFAAARGMTEKQATLNNPPDFSQLLGMDDRDLQLQAERRRASLAGNTSSLPQLGSLGLDFGSDDPFADPVKPSAGWRPPNPSANGSSNPFADPPSRPQPTVPKASTYIAKIRRSRGQSVDATTTSNNASSALNNNAYRPPSTAVASRYPSSIAPSRDSYRDTVFSTFSANVRKGKGRSDPFDLERPELWRPRDDVVSKDMYPRPLNSGVQSGRVSVAQPRIISTTGTYTSKYSSGVSSIGDWGEPGPDLGPGSGSSSMRGNASSNGGSGDFSGKGIYGTDGLQGRSAEIGKGEGTTWDTVRKKDNVSPVSVESKASSKNGVGKAM
jgi:hypothetical protein